MRKFLLLFMLWALSGTQAVAATGQSQVISFMASVLNRHRLIAFGEGHGSVQQHRFLQALIRDRRFICRVNDVVVEFGTARHQAIADRYVRGDAVPLTEVRRIWRETGQWTQWDSPVYAEIFSAVREVNRRRLCRHRIRVLLGDPPIDWTNVNSAADYARYADRGGSYAGVVEREVLAKGRRALLIAGGTHITKHASNAAPDRQSWGQLLNARHPGVLYSVLALPPREGLAERVGLPPAPSITPVADVRARTLFDFMPSGLLKQVTVNGNRQWVSMTSDDFPALADSIDAVLNLGADATLSEPPPELYRDPVYQAELRRKARVMTEFYGADFNQELEALLARANRH